MLTLSTLISFASQLSQWFLNLLSNQAWAGLCPRLGLTEDSRTTDFQLGLLVLILIECCVQDSYEHI